MHIRIVLFLILELTGDIKKINILILPYIMAVPRSGWSIINTAATPQTRSGTNPVA